MCNLGSYLKSNSFFCYGFMWIDCCEAECRALFSNGWSWNGANTARRCVVMCLDLSSIVPVGAGTSGIQAKLGDLSGSYLPWIVMYKMSWPVCRSEQVFAFFLLSQTSF